MTARFNLPEIEYISSDVEELENLGVSTFEGLIGTTLNEADPRRKLLQSVAFVASMLANNIDFTGKQTRLTYAQDDYLDHIGVEREVPRLEAQPAEATFRFEVTNTVPFTIFQGFLIGAGETRFEIKSDTLVPANIGQIDIVGRCVESGVSGNGYLPGQINQLIEPVPHVAAVTNVTESFGGTDREEDDPYAERIWLSPEGYSTAGPELAYVYHAKSAHQGIIDVATVTPSPGRVVLYVLMEQGALPSPEVLQKVSETCNDKSIRPLTDFVTVAAAERVPYDLTVSYYLPESTRSLQSYYQQQVTDAIQDYHLWQRSKMGRGVDPGELYSRIQQAGAKRVIVEPNQFISLGKHQVAFEDTINVTFGGFVSD